MRILGKKPQFKHTFDKSVILPSLIFIVGVCLLAALFPKLINGYLSDIKNFVFVNLNWLYVWCVTIFVIFLVFLMFSRYGNIQARY
ncbi:BCCT family transporter [Sphingobacterium olei]|uniref:BCCT family transporter n=1 Tax=Sphingobacterium olei TaxID=2571155 RepID=UPI001EE3CD82|nr:BCCT family transporter [Sphingobacterium olei]